MIVRRSKWMMMLLTCAVSVAWVAAEPAQTAPSPPPPAGGQEAPQGSEVKGDFVTMLTLVLNLTADQQTQVKAIYEDTRAKAKVIADSKTLSQDEKKVKIQELREAANTKIRPLLTPDQQQRFDEVLKQLQGGAAPPPPPNPR